MVELTSKRYAVDTYEEGIELFHEKGWTDGLPVTLPTPAKVAAFLEHAGLAPDEVVGRIPDRNREITAEKVAINAVMAGCCQEYMPVVLAGVKAITDPRFEFNHLASLGSPAPIIIVSGPIVDELKMSHGTWLLGPGSRVNTAIGRALGLLLWNGTDLRPTGIQRGTYGNPMRWTGCIAEDPSPSAWPTLREQFGFAKTDSTVTAYSNHGYTQMLLTRPHPEDTLSSLADALATGGGSFFRGAYIFLLGPSIIERFTDAGWTWEAAREWLFDHTGRSLADIKRRGLLETSKALQLWRTDPEANTGDPILDNIAAGKITPEDEDTFIRLFRSNGEQFDDLLWPLKLYPRINDVYVLRAGGDVAYAGIVMAEYGVSTNPVTVKI